MRRVIPALVWVGLSGCDADALAACESYVASQRACFAQRNDAIEFEKTSYADPCGRQSELTGREAVQAVAKWRCFDEIWSTSDCTEPRFRDAIRERTRECPHQAW